MKKYLAFLLSLILVLSFLIAGCSSPTTTTSTSTATATTTATAVSTSTATATTTATVKAITLRYSDGNSRNGWYGQHTMLPWIESMEKATNGQLKFEVYDSETLLKHPATWTGVTTGVADVGWMSGVVAPGKFPLGDIITLPLLPFKTSEHASEVFWKLFQKYPSMQAEFKDVHVLGISASQPYFLLNSKRQIKGVPDLKGLILRVSAGGQADMLKAMGASPTSMSMSEVYINLQKGVLDGLATPWEAVYSWKFYEIASYYTYMPLFCNDAFRIMNLNVWNGLPADIQKALNATNDLQAMKTWGKTQFDDIAKTARTELQGKGVKMDEYTLPDSELKMWQDTYAKPIWDAWVNKMKDAGHPEAQDILNDAFKFAEETKAQYQ
jgi:TRAP-type transport system periplasmic protein